MTSNSQLPAAGFSLTYRCRKNLRQDETVPDMRTAYGRNGSMRKIIGLREKNELQIIDIRTPEELIVVARQVMFNPHGLAIHEEYLLVCDGTAGLKVVDVSNRNEPEILSTDNIPFAYDIIVDFPSAIVVGEGVLYQYDLSNLPEIIKTNELVLTN